MSKPISFRAHYEPAEGEVFEVEVVMQAPYPVAVDEIRQQVTATMERMITFAISAYKTSPDT